jgi:hypothetical protein
MSPSALDPRKIKHLVARLHHWDARLQQEKWSNKGFESPMLHQEKSQQSQRVAGFFR